MPTNKVFSVTGPDYLSSCDLSGQSPNRSPGNSPDQLPDQLLGQSLTDSGLGVTADFVADPVTGCVTGCVIDSVARSVTDSVPEIDFALRGYDFPLPENLIAQKPCAERGDSKLLVLDREKSELHEARFKNLADFLPKPSLLVANNAKVAPLRLLGAKKTGGKLEFLLLTPLPLIADARQTSGRYTAEVEGLLRGIKKIALGESFDFGPHIKVTLLEKQEFGRCRAVLSWEAPLAARLLEQGRLPLPPYIRREPEGFDLERYQTVFAQEDKLGAAAAPTAGLHFTPELKAGLLRAGHSWTELSLYVGYGTFSPVRGEDIREHVMHSELIEISSASAQAVSRAKEAGRPVLAVGTTSARGLEGAWKKLGKIAPYSGETDIFIYPGQEIHVVDHMITNFHLPKSSLLMLVSALTGRERLLKAYEEAVKRRFKFFSYGDAMLIL